MTSSCISPVSTDEMDGDIFPITDVSQQSFATDKRQRVEQPYAAYAVNPYEVSMYQPTVSIPSAAVTVPLMSPQAVHAHPLGSPSLYDFFPSDPSIDSFPSLHAYDDTFSTLPEITPTLYTLPSLSYPSLFSTGADMGETDSTNWLI